MIRCALFTLSTIGTIALVQFSTAADLLFESKPVRTHLLELFTSEGCSSCPPAEAWLSKLKDEARLWQDFVPLAFHVDYWDHLGWRDPFASKAWTARQYEYSARWKSSSVYTPGFVLDGREWRNSEVPLATTDTPGILRISVKDQESVTATFQPANADGGSFDLHVARLGFGLKINVKAGENSGRKVLHDFVVLSLTNERMASDAKELRLPASAVKQEASSPGAIAAWITETGQMKPIQAVGGWLR